MAASIRPSSASTAVGDGRLGLVEVDVGDRDVVERLAVRGDRHERRSDATRTDHEYAHDADDGIRSLPRPVRSVR